MTGIFLNVFLLLIDEPARQIISTINGNNALFIFCATKNQQHKNNKRKTVTSIEYAFTHLPFLWIKNA